MKQKFKVIKYGKSWVGGKSKSRFAKTKHEAENLAKDFPYHKTKIFRGRKVIYSGIPKGKKKLLR